MDMLRIRLYEIDDVTGKTLLWIDKMTIACRPMKGEFLVFDFKKDAEAAELTHYEITAVEHIVNPVAGFDLIVYIKKHS